MNHEHRQCNANDVNKKASIYVQYQGRKGFQLKYNYRLLRGVCKQTQAYNSRPKPNITGT